jgi:hypothetical protein
MQKKKEPEKKRKPLNPRDKQALAYMTYYMSRLAKAIRESKKA